MKRKWARYDPKVNQDRNDKVETKQACLREAKQPKGPKIKRKWELKHEQGEEL